MKKRVISLVLCLNILLSVVPYFSAFAAGTAWDGSTMSAPAQEDGVYQIGSGAELAWFAAEVNNNAAKQEAIVSLNAVLTDDIDLGGKAWTPISNTAYVVYAYGGHFDGQGHTVSGLAINVTSANYGLFGVVNGGTIENIRLQGTVSSTNVAGGLIGKLQTGTVQNCSFSGSVSSTGKTTKGYVGGIIGTVAAKDAVIKGCANFGDISGTFAGGMVGYNKNNGSISYCYNTGTITGTSRSGGIAGQQSSGTLAYCYNIGESTNGICGFSNAGVTACYYLNDEAAAPGGSATGYQKITDAAALLTALNAGEETLFTADSDHINGGYPVLTWQASSAPVAVEVKTVSLVGTAVTGGSLSAEALGADNQKATNVTYRWFVSEDGETFSAIAGAESAVFNIPDTAEYAGKVLKVRATGEADSAAEAVSEGVTKSASLIQRENEAAVAEAVKTLEIDESAIKEPTVLALPAAIGTCSVKWESSDESIIATDGTVNLPQKNIASVTLTALITCGEASADKIFTIDVWAKDVDADVYLQKALDTLKWSFSALQPTFGKDTNMVVKFNALLKAKGLEGITVTVESTADDSLVAKTGKITYPHLLDGGSFAQGKQVQVFFRLTLEDQSVIYPTTNNYALLIPWDTTDVRAALQESADALLTAQNIKGDNESLESVQSDLVLPACMQGDKYDFAWVEWESSDASHLAVDGSGRTGGADALYAPFAGVVYRDAEAHEVTLTATVRNPSTDVSVQKSFTVTVAPYSEAELAQTLETMQAILDCYRADKLTDFTTKQPIDTAAVENDIQLVIPKKVVTKEELASLEYGEYWDYWNYKFTVTSSDEETVTVNAFRANVFRPYGEDASADKAVTLTVSMQSKRNPNLSVSKEIPITVKHFGMAEIDEALALMDQAKIHYAEGLLGNNADIYSVIDNLTPYTQIVYNADKSGVDFVYDSASAAQNGVYVDTLPGWEKQEDWRLFRTSNRDLIANETLVLNTTPAQNTCVKIESVLTDSAFGKYYAQFKNTKRYSASTLEKLKQLYRQPVSTYVIVLGGDGYSAAYAALSAEEKAAQNEKVIRDYKESLDQKVTVTFTLLGYGGEVMIAPTEVNDFTAGTTVFEVFRKVLADNHIEYTAKGSYIASIGGLSEFDYGKYSGWMYTVGGVYVNAPMNAQTIQGGEEIVVKYVDSYVEEDKTDIAPATVSGIANKIYTGKDTGKALTQNITVMYDGKTLVQNEDYTVSFDALAKPGTVKVYIKGMGQYKGLITKQFKVLPAKPAVRAAALTSDAVKLAWNQVPGAAYYRVYEYNTKTKKYTRLATTKNTYVLIKNQPADSVHYYLVKACALGSDGAEYCNAFTVKDTLKVIFLCKAPAVKAVVSGKTVTLKWAKCAGANFYRVYEWNAKTKQYAARANTAAVSLKLTKCTKGTHYYLVRAFNGAGAGSAFSARNHVKVTIK